MKNIKRIGLTLCSLSTLLFVSSCSSDPTPEPEVEPEITIHDYNNMFLMTSKAIGESIMLEFAEEDLKKDIWIDLNNDHRKGADEIVTQQRTAYTIQSQIFHICGDVSELDCHGNELTIVGTYGNEALQELRCDHNHLEGLDLTHNSKLTKLHCQSNDLFYLNVGENSQLKTLSCEDNQIEFIYISEPQFSSLQHNEFMWTKDAEATYNTHEFSYGNLSYIELVTKKRIGETIRLVFSEKELSRTVWVDLNNNKTQDEGEKVTAINTLYTLQSQTFRIYGGVTFLNCSRSQLTSLDMHRNHSLSTLYCFANQLTTLDVRGLERLWTMDCSSNSIDKILVNEQQFERISSRWTKDEGATYIAMKE